MPAPVHISSLIGRRIAEGMETIGFCFAQDMIMKQQERIRELQGERFSFPAAGRKESDHMRGSGAVLLPAEGQIHCAAGHSGKSITGQCSRQGPHSGSAVPENTRSRRRPYSIRRSAAMTTRNCFSRKNCSVSFKVNGCRKIRTGCRKPWKFVKEDDSFAVWRLSDRSAG